MLPDGSQKQLPVQLESNSTKFWLSLKMTTKSYQHFPEFSSIKMMTHHATNNETAKNQVKFDAVWSRFHWTCAMFMASLQLSADVFELSLAIPSCYKLSPQVRWKSPVRGNQQYTGTAVENEWKWSNSCWKGAFLLAICVCHRVKASCKKQSNFFRITQPTQPRLHHWPLLSAEFTLQRGTQPAVPGSYGFGEARLFAEENLGLWWSVSVPRSAQHRSLQEKEIPEMQSGCSSVFCFKGPRSAGLLPLFAWPKLTFPWDFW